MSKIMKNVLGEQKTFKAVKKGAAIAFAVACLSACQNTDTKSLASTAPAAADSDLRLVSELPAPQNTNNGTQQLIAANDVLEIDVFQVDQLDKTVQVDANGSFSMPLIGQVSAIDKSVPALENELEQRYGTNYLQSPDITVFVKESAGQRMTLDGEFNKPGIYPTGATSTLLRAVAQASGLTKISDDEKVYVFRENNGKKFVANYNLKSIRLGERTDPRIFGGDIIVAFPSRTKVATENLRVALGSAVNVARVSSLGF